MKSGEAEVIERTLNLKWPFGKYKGQRLEDIPSGYIRWAAENFNNNTWAAACDLVWRYREQTGSHVEG